MPCRKPRPSWLLMTHHAQLRPNRSVGLIWAPGMRSGPPWRRSSGVEALAEAVEGLIKGRGELGGEVLRLAELLEDLRLLGLEEAIEADLEVLDPAGRDV